MKLVILGGHADGINCIEIAESISNVEVLGFLNDDLPTDSDIYGYPILGNCNQWANLHHEILFIYTMQHTKKMQSRHDKLLQLNIPLNRFATLIHPQTFVSKYVKVGHGTIIYPYTTIQNTTTIGNFCSIRTGVSIGHDCSIGDFCYIGPKSTILSNATMQTGSYVASNVVLGDMVKLGQYAIASSGAIINKSVPEFTIAQGNPARLIGKVSYE